ncbi:MAG: hypothetical protein V7765_21275 [Oleispira sp.]
MELEQYTYKDISRLVDREEMLKENVSSLGTQAGGFGIFTEQARVLTWAGADQIKKEIADNASLNVYELLESCPTLKALIK